MTLTINTNVASMIAQHNLDNATKSLNTSLERLSTGFKINHAADNAAGYSISDRWVTHLGSLDIASDNAAMGNDLLATAEQTYGLLTSHLQRIRDLSVQAGNGTYGSTSLKAMQAEIDARLKEISRIAANTEYNGVKLMSYSRQSADADYNKTLGIKSTGIDLQVGLYADKDSIINLDIDLFTNATVSGLFKGMESKTIQGVTFTQMYTAAKGSYTPTSTKYNSDDGYAIIAAACSGLKVLSKDATTGEYSFALQTATDRDANKMIGFIDAAISDISTRVTNIGASQNRVDSAISSIEVQNQNITSSLSTLRDTDVAEESSKYIQSQILQQASATLLATANQSPSIALNLI